MELIAETKRIGVIDVARFYAMALVFYGHFIERIMMLKNPAAATQYKFIYSFHMILFFVLAGYVVQERYVEFSFGKYLKHRFMSRLLPFLFFTAIFMLLPVFFSGDFVGLPLPSIKGYVRGLIMTLFGLPVFCVPSWFILMIFSVEMVHYAAFRFLKSSNLKILIGALLFYVAGYWLNLPSSISKCNTLGFEASAL
ncbi:MAG: acyltransferase family protein [Deltaproteobacteria bacterium]|nr:acyltransferase family protein [Deltaproteobacteria bacterium]